MGNCCAGQGAFSNVSDRRRRGRNAIAVARPVAKSAQVVGSGTVTAAPVQTVGLEGQPYQKGMRAFRPKPTSGLRRSRAAQHENLGNRRFICYLSKIPDMNTPQNKSFAEFFAGIGLMRMGLERADWKISFANDIDEDKWCMYRDHFGDTGEFILGDVHGLDPKSVPEVALATASFPCNDLSLAGARKGLLF